MDDMALRPWNGIELCAGGAGIGLGIELAVPHARCVAYVEREAAAAALLVTRMAAGDLAPAPVWSDLATFDARPWRGRVHWVASGDPCQGNSVAGKRLGILDERFLIDQVVRVVSECRPLRLFRENVPGNADGQLAAIAPPLEALGYRVAVGLFSSKDTRNSHGRERLVIMADREDGPGWLYPRPWRPGEGEIDARGTGAAMADAASRQHEIEALDDGIDRERTTVGWRTEQSARTGAGRAARGGIGPAGIDGDQAAAGDGVADRRDREDLVDADSARRTATWRRSSLDAGSQPVAGGRELANTLGHVDRGQHVAGSVRAPSGEAEGTAQGPDGQRRRSRPRVDRADLLDAEGERRREGQPEYAGQQGRYPAAGAGDGVADADVTRSSVGVGAEVGRGALGKEGPAARTGGRHVADAEHGGPQDIGGLSAQGRQPDAGHGRIGFPVIVCPPPGDPIWRDILDADPLLQPSLGRIDFWAIARRNLGLAPLVDAIGRRGGMARDLDAATTAAVKSEVRRISDALAGRVERLRLLGNGVDPVVAWDAWVHLDALHRAFRERTAGATPVSSE